MRVLLILWSTSLQSSVLQDFLKRLLPKLSATRTLRLCRSLCLRHLREIVCFHLRVLPLSVCLLYVVGLLYHSIFRKNQKTYQTRLYIPVSSIEKMVGIAIAPITRWTGAWVRNVYLSLTALFYNLSYPAEEFFQGIVATVRTVPR